MNVLDIIAPDTRATLRDEFGWLADWARGGGPNVSGQHVNQRTALKLSAYFACINNISEDIAKSRFKIRREDDATGNRMDARDHPLWRPVNIQPNPVMSAMSFWQTIVAHALGYHGGFAEIVDAGITGGVQLWPIPPTWVEVSFDHQTNAIQYIVRPETGGEVRLPPDKMFHLHGLGFDAVTGYVLSELGSISIGAALGAQEHRAAYFKNGATLSGILQTPPGFGEKAIKRLGESWRSNRSGSDNAGSTPILQHGAEWKPTQTDPEKTQMIQSLNFSVEDIARPFRMQLSKIGHLIHAGVRANVEQENRAYHGDTLLGWSERCLQEIELKLIRNEPGIVVEQDFSNLLKADTEKHSKKLTEGFQRGQYTINDQKRESGENTIGPIGDVRFVPATMITLERAMQPEPEPTPPVRDEETGRQLEDAVAASAAGANGSGFGPILSTAHRGILAEHFQRFLSTQLARARASMKAGKLHEWQREFYPQHQEYVATQIEATIRAHLVSTWEADDVGVSSAQAISISMAEAFIRLSRRWTENTVTGLSEDPADVIAKNAAQYVIDECAKGLQPCQTN